MAGKRQPDALSPGLGPESFRSARYIPPPDNPIIFGKKPPRRYHHGRMHEDDFNTKFGNRLLDVLPGTEYCDVTLRAGKAAFKGHKIILAAYSPFFHETFLERPVEGSYLELQLDGTSPIGLAALVDFVYTGTFKVNENTVTAVLQTAKDYKVPAMTEMCEIYLLDEVKVDDANFVRMYNIAREFDLEKVIEECDLFFTGTRVHYDTYLNFLKYAKYQKSDKVYQKVFEYVIREHERLVKAEGLLDMLDHEEMKQLLMVDRHEFYTSVSLIELLINWFEYKLELRLPHLVDLFKKINLRVFDEEKLDYIAEMRLIKDDPRCQRLIEDTRRYLDSFERTVARNGPFLLTISSTNIELRSVTDSLSAEQQNILVMPRIPQDFKNVPGDTTQRTPIVAVLNNVLFVFGLYWRGKKESNLFHDAALSCHNYDPYRNQWQELSSLQGARAGSLLIVCGGKIYSIAGMNSISPNKLNQVEVYYPNQDTWRSTTPLPYSVAMPLAAAASDGHIYISFAKAWNSQYQREFFRFNTAAETWLRRALSPALQDYHDVGSCGGKVYLFGTCSKGLYSSGYLRADCYEPSIDQWTMIQTRRFGSFSNFQTLPLKDTIYIVADYQVETHNGHKKEKTGIFSFDTSVQDLLIEKEYQRFERERTAAALLFVPEETLIV